MTTTPDSTIAVNHATTAVQTAASASEPASGTSSESVLALLCTTTSGTIPMASTPSSPRSSGMVKLVTSPASMSGSRLRIAANSAPSTERTCCNEGRAISQPGRSGVESTSRPKAPANPSTIDSWSGTSVVSQAIPTITVPL